MKIIHYVPSIDRTSGGVGTYMQLLAKELGKLVELHVVTHRSPNMLEITHAQVHFITGGTQRLLQTKKEWCILLNRLNPDVVHENCCWMPSNALTQRWAQQFGYKVVLTPHGMLEPWILKRHYWTKKAPALWLYQKDAVVKADYLHATAEDEKKNLLRLGYNRKIEVIANGIDVDTIRMKTSWKRKKQILFLSRIHVKKGINYLIEAVAVLKEELKDYKINIAGEGEESYINELKQMTSQSGVTDSICFVGGVYGDEKWELFRNTDVFVLPTHSENFGIVVAEALACGTPVITTKGTPWHELRTENCGWWTEVGTEPTVNALRAFLQLAVEELEKMGHNGRRLVEREYSSKKVAEDMVALYKKVINNT